MVRWRYPGGYIVTTQGIEFLRASLERMALGGQRVLPDATLRAIADGAPALADTVEKVRRVHWHSPAVEGWHLLRRGFVSVEVSCIVPIPVRHVYPVRGQFAPLPADPVRGEWSVTDKEGRAHSAVWHSSDAKSEREGEAERALFDVATRRFGDGKQSLRSMVRRRDEKQAIDVDVSDARETLEYCLSALNVAYDRREPVELRRKLHDCLEHAARELKDAIVRQRAIKKPPAYKFGQARRAWLCILWELGYVRQLFPSDVSADQSDDGRRAKYNAYLTRVATGKGRTVRARFNVTTRGDRTRQQSQREARQAKLLAAAQLVDSGHVLEARRLIGVA
jgi:hypothetical protein